ncbi:hypothetical protein EV175_004255 [Coemansia sp. RSA 1933]|nr:hypothetical protein EV175_004255 [Coemansia sp. RSA 1933]
MKTFAVVAALGTVLLTGGVASSADEFIGDPMVIYLEPASVTVETVAAAAAAESTTYSTAAETSSVAVVSSAPAATVAATTSAVASSTVYETQQTTSTGDIPDGQGNDFNVPSGAVRFPWNYNNADRVVPITPSSDNGGWAMSPNQMCTPGSWCPYACESGYYSAQWDPSALVYNGAGSMNGGLYADASGTLTKPYPSRAFCEPGLFNAQIQNTLGQSVSACQTIYPGNEAMLIPTVAQGGGTASLNVVPHTYWLGTSAQFYVNLAGSTDAQCIWGTSAEPVGNWGPFIFGAGQGSDNNTYISVQYNPLYLQAGFKATDTYNVRIDCLSGNCNFPTGGKCQCEQGTCSIDNGCTVALTGDAQAAFVIY